MKIFNMLFLFFLCSLMFLSLGRDIQNNSSNKTILHEKNYTESLNCNLNISNNFYVKKYQLNNLLGKFKVDDEFSYSKIYNVSNIKKNDMECNYFINKVEKKLKCDFYIASILLESPSKCKYILEENAYEDMTTLKYEFKRKKKRESIFYVNEILDYKEFFKKKNLEDSLLKSDNALHNPILNNIINKKSNLLDRHKKIKYSKDLTENSISNTEKNINNTDIKNKVSDNYNSYLNSSDNCELTDDISKKLNKLGQFYYEKIVKQDNNNNKNKFNSNTLESNINENLNNKNEENIETIENIPGEIGKFLNDQSVVLIPKNKNVNKKLKSKHLINVEKQENELNKKDIQYSNIINEFLNKLIGSNTNDVLSLYVNNVSILKLFNREYLSSYLTHKNKLNDDLKQLKSFLKKEIKRNKIHDYNAYNTIKQLNDVNLNEYDSKIKSQFRSILKNLNLKYNDQLSIPGNLDNSIKSYLINFNILKENISKSMDTMNFYLDHLNKIHSTRLLSEFERLMKIEIKNKLSFDKAERCIKNVRFIKNFRWKKKKLNDIKLSNINLFYIVKIILSSLELILYEKIDINMKIITTLKKLLEDVIKIINNELFKSLDLITMRMKKKGVLLDKIEKEIVLLFFSCYDRNISESIKIVESSNETLINKLFLTILYYKENRLLHNTSKFNVLFNTNDQLNYNENGITNTLLQKIRKYRLSSSDKYDFELTLNSLGMSKSLNIFIKLLNNLKLIKHCKELDIPIEDSLLNNIKKYLINVKKIFENIKYINNLKSLLDKSNKYRNNLRKLLILFEIYFDLVYEIKEFSKNSYYNEYIKELNKLLLNVLNSIKWFTDYILNNF